MAYSREKQSEYVLNRYHRIRLELIKTLGSRCNGCGSFEGLEFDHIDPETKSFSIGKLNSKSSVDISNELEKCQLLCSNCHLEKHAPKHGTYSRYRSYKFLCRCNLCIKAGKEYNKNYNRTKRKLKI